MNNSHATFAGGCFWCLEAIFNRIKGVESVVSGYTGGTLNGPTYDQVCSGKTGHAEAVRIHFDPTQITFTQLLEIFFALHDPTTLNRQGNDIGTQYRSVIFFENATQQQEAITLIQKLTRDGKYPQPIVTDITPLETFFPAEVHHQQFYESNRTHGYCRVIIDPKISKLLKQFSELAK